MVMENIIKNERKLNEAFQIKVSVKAEHAMCVRYF